MKSYPNWIVRVRDRSTKDISKFPKNDRERVLLALENLSLDPYGGDLEKMKGETMVWRRRVGNYRILFEIFAKERVIYVFSVERRTSATY